MKQLASLPPDVCQLLANLIRVREEGKPFLANLIKNQLELRAEKLDIPINTIYEFYGNIDDPAQLRKVYDKLHITSKYRLGSRKIVQPHVNHLPVRVRRW